MKDIELLEALVASAIVALIVNELVDACFKPSAEVRSTIAVVTLISSVLVLSNSKLPHLKEWSS